MNNIKKPARGARGALLAAALFIPLLSACAGLSSNQAPLDAGLVEIIREEYEIESRGTNHYIVYDGTVKNWLEKNVYAVTANFVGYDKDGKPALTFKQVLADKLAGGEALAFAAEHYAAGTSVDRIIAKITYHEKKPKVLGFL